MRSSLPFQLRASGLGVIFSTRLDGSKEIQSVKSTCSVLYSELKAYILPSLEVNNKGHKTNKHTQTHKFLTEATVAKTNFSHVN